MWVEDKASKKLNRESFSHFGFLFVREVLLNYSVSKRAKSRRDYHNVERKLRKAGSVQSVIPNE